MESKSNFGTWKRFRQTLSKILTQGNYQVHQHITLIMISIFLLGMVGILWNLSQIAKHSLETSALRDVARFSEAITEFRTLYTSEVVARVRTHGIEVTHDYTTKDGAIPLPATLSMVLGKHLGQKIPGVQVRLYSSCRFHWRTDGGPIDDFEREALQQLNQYPGQPFIRFEEFDGQPVLRYATADLMRADCVPCHNTHPDSPKTDWHEGEVRGILEIIRPIDSIFQHVSPGLWGALIVTLIMTMLGMAGMFLVFDTLRRNSNDLEKYANELEDEINERKRIEETLRKSDKLKDEFIANISHELRTPMTGIVGFAELLSMGTVEDENEKQEYYRNILQDGQRLIRILNNVINLSLLESGSKEVVWTPVQIIKLGKTLEYTWAEKLGDHLVIDFPAAGDPAAGDPAAGDPAAGDPAAGDPAAGDPGAGPAAESDPEEGYQEEKEGFESDANLLKIIFNELIQNSLMFNRNEPKIKISVQVKNDRVVFEIEDHGIGINEEHFSKIFDKFYRVESDIQYEFKGGIGLGLAVVKEATELLNGTVSVESTLGKGSLFSVEFPKRREAKPE